MDGSKFDRAKAIKILDFWRKVEFFIPYDLSQVIESGSETYRLDREELSEQLPQNLFWLNPNSRTDEARYYLYIGLFDSADIEEICRQSDLLETDEIRRIEDSERGIGETCFARLPLDNDGRAHWDKFSISTLPWALSRLKSGNLNELCSDSFGRAKQELRRELDNFASTLERSQTEPSAEDQAIASLPRPLTGMDIVKLTDLLFSWSGYTPKQNSMALLQVYPQTALRRAQHVAHGASTSQDERHGSDRALKVDEGEDDEEIDQSTSIDILNSFYLEDLEDAIRAIKAGDRYPSLDSYLQDLSLSHVDLYSIEGMETIRRKLQPKFTNSGRWLDKPEQFMSLMQQFAINASLENLSHAGLYAVNGPPGTGKTTMLKDIIAENLVQRARALSKLQSPEKAWARKESVYFAGDDIAYKIGILDESLRGFEMVVASSNNTAVENISKDLPLQKISRDIASKNISYLLPVARKLYADHKNGRVIPLKDEDQPWGLIAAVLGRKSNRQRFVQRLIFNPDSKDQAENRKQKGEYLNVRDWADGYDGASFQEASIAFNSVDRKLQRRLLDLQEYATLHSEFGDISEDVYCEADLIAVSQAREAQDFAEREITSLDAKKTSLVEALKRLEREEELLQKLVPPWYKIWLIWSAENQDREAKFRINRMEQIRLSEEIRHIEENRSKQITGYNTAAEALQTAQVDLNSKRSIFAKATERLSKFAAEFAVRCFPYSLEELEKADNQKTAPWQDATLNNLRSELFAAALQLHESWLASVLKNNRGFRPNTLAIAKLLKGVMPRKPEHVLPIWQSLFMIVPVVSTTFASFHRQFLRLPAQTLGWLFIDEAGQAVPQAAIGALKACRRALVIGDPMQIEPIFGVRTRLIERLANEDRDLITQYGPHLVSIQKLADRSNVYGATIKGDEKETWIGSPLRVHRRCSNPMFEVANYIAYNNKMIQGKPDASLVSDSCWFHLTGTRSDGQYVREHGEFAFDRIISSFLNDGSQLPKAYIISPFRRVAQKLRSLIGDQQQWISRLPPGVKPPNKRHLRDWTLKRIGTVHTFQGKEEDEVFLVLGADRNSPGSARWAASKPNLLNVALTRAKSRIYVVGDRQLWGTLPYFDQIANKLNVVAVTDISNRL